MADPDLRDTPPPTSLIVGASGFLGRHFLAAYGAVDPRTRGTSHKDPALLPLDLGSPRGLDWDPAALGCRDALLLAACSKIGPCESEPEVTRKVNVEGTLEFAERLLEAGLNIVFFSSDYVFAGDTGQYPDSAATNPSTEYGRHKAEVERRLLELAPERALIVRLSRTYGLEKGDNTLLDELAAKLLAGDPIQAAYDQVFSPTWSSDVVRAVAALQSAGARGIVNVCSSERFSRYDVTLQVAAALDVDPGGLVERVELHSLGLAGHRPLDTSLVPERLSQLGLAPFRTLADSIREVARRYILPGRS